MDEIPAGTSLNWLLMTRCFWMVHGGADPLSYLKKYPGRFELMHLKELRHDIPGNNKV